MNNLALNCQFISKKLMTDRKIIVKVKAESSKIKPYFVNLEAQ